MVTLSGAESERRGSDVEVILQVMGTGLLECGQGTAAMPECKAEFCVHAAMLDQ
jgi:hypothetical protein